MMLTTRFDEAFAYARRLHNDQRRKATAIPYVSHLMCVSGLVLEHGGDEDQAIAGLLHDAAEDCGGADTLRVIRTRFGDRVADCTDAWVEPKPEWKGRKLAYLAKLPAKPQASLLVSLADKTHNAEAIYTDLLTIGERIWDRFSVERAETLWYYRELARIFQDACPGPLAKRFDRAVRAMQEGSYDSPR